MKTFAISIIFFASFISTSNSQERLSFSYNCGGNAVESCVIWVAGTIDAEAPERFQEFLEEKQPESFIVALDSTGGNLGAGLQLGRMIRAGNYVTHVARTVEAIYAEEQDGAQCLSACAYAFLGGSPRYLVKGAKLGFHQFDIAGSKGLQIAGASDLVLSQGQQIAGLLISYLVEMGVDPRLFTLASGTETDGMLFPKTEQLEEYDITTKRGFSEFELEGFRNGVLPF